PVLQSAHQGGYARDEEGVADDRAGDRGLDELYEPAPQREDRDDQLGGVAEGRRQQAAEPRARVRREVLGRLADPVGEGNERDRAADEGAPLGRAQETGGRGRGETQGEPSDPPHAPGSL